MTRGVEWYGSNLKPTANDLEHITFLFFKPFCRFLHFSMLMFKLYTIPTDQRQINNSITTGTAEASSVGLLGSGCNGSVGLSFTNETMNWKCTSWDNQQLYKSVWKKTTIWNSRRPRKFAPRYKMACVRVYKCMYERLCAYRVPDKRTLESCGKPITTL